MVDKMEVFITDNNSINIIKRLDFNYCKPRGKILSEDSKIEVKTICEWGGKNCLTTSAFYPAITHFYRSKKDRGDLIPFIRVEDTRKYLLEFKNTVFLDREVLDDLKTNIKRVKNNDVVITKGGEYIGEAALVPDYYDEYAICRDLLAIKTEFMPFSGQYLCTFFLSDHGKEEIMRTKSVQGQPHLTLEKIREIKVPYFGIEFEEEVIEYWQSFFELINKSNSNLVRIENLLNTALKNKLFEEEINNYFSKKLTEVNLIRRMDVEYYQEKWSKLVCLLKSLNIKFENINIKKDRINKEEKEYKYIEIANIDDRSGIIKGFSEKKYFDLPERAQWKIEYNDLLVSSLKGSKEKIALVDIEDNEDLVASNGFYVVKSDFLNPEVLYAIFRSRFYELFIEQMATGSIMSAITNKYFQMLELPIINDEIQNDIQKEVQSYLENRKSAFENLELIKSKMNDMIEQIYS